MGFHFTRPASANTAALILHVIPQFVCLFSPFRSSINYRSVRVSLIASAVEIRCLLLMFTRNNVCVRWKSRRPLATVAEDRCEFIDFALFGHCRRRISSADHSGSEFRAFIRARTLKTLMKPIDLYRRGG